MLKIQEVIKRRSCFRVAFWRERLFVLLARDAAAPATILFWAFERVRLGLNKDDDAQITEARNCAIRMDAERDGIRRKAGRIKQAA